MRKAAGFHPTKGISHTAEAALAYLPALWKTDIVCMHLLDFLFFFPPFKTFLALTKRTLTSDRRTLKGYYRQLL